MHFLKCLILCFLPLISLSNPNSLPFYEGPFHEIQKQADFAGKPYILYLYQNACSTCENLESFTFLDFEVQEYIAGNYLACKKNVQTFEGAQLSKTYGTSEAGTVLIFASNGDLRELVQEVISPEGFLQLLRFHAEIPTEISPPIQTTQDLVSEAPTYETGYVITEQREREPFLYSTYHRPSEESSTFGNREEPFGTSYNQPESWEGFGNNFAENSRREAGYQMTRRDRDQYRGNKQRRPQRFNRTESSYIKCIGEGELSHTTQKLDAQGISNYYVVQQGYTGRGRPIYMILHPPSNRNNERYRFDSPTSRYVSPHIQRTYPIYVGSGF